MMRMSAASKSQRFPFVKNHRREGCTTGENIELELELIQPHMAQKPVLRGEVGARALRVRSVSREEAWASAGVQGACVGRLVWV